MPPSKTPRRPFGQTLRRWRARFRRGPSWEVAALVREPTALVVAFAAHHLALGATTVSIYLDDPDDPAAEALAQIRGVRLVRCDATFWQAQPGGRPKISIDRQILVYADALRALNSDWLATIDADEFLWVSGSMQQALAGIPDGAPWVRLPVAERIWVEGDDRTELFGGHFRTPVQDGPDAVDALYGEGRQDLYPKGTAGHPFGKPMVPAGTPHQINVHSVHDASGKPVRPAATAPGVRLLHFEGLSPDHWARKHLMLGLLILDGHDAVRKVRRQVTTSIIHHDDPLSAARAQFERTYAIPASVARKLDAGDHLVRLDFDVRAALDTHAPGHGISLTTKALDAAVEVDLRRALDAVFAGRRAA